MARVRNNIIIKGLTGSLGDQLVIKSDKAGRTIVAVKPEYAEGRQFTEAQLAHQEEFREAIAYAKSAKSDPTYAEKAKDTPLSSFNVAAADWMHTPEILDVDLSAWSGQAGQVIRAQAIDDVKVTQMSVVITDEAGAVLESGPAVEGEGLWWQYVTTTTAAGNPNVMVSAQDLPGHIAKMTKSRA